MNTFTLNYICSISSILLFGMDKRNKKKKCGYINTPPSNRMERCYQLHPCLKISSTSYILTKLLSNLSKKKKKTLRECSCFLPFYARSTKCCILCSCYIQKLSEMLSLQKKTKSEELSGLYLFIVKNKNTKCTLQRVRTTNK